jgi:hypothetical protein
MKKLRRQFDPLPGDGWISLAPGAFVAFHDDTPLKPSLFELRKWMSDIRGGVLSLSFTIENELILLILANDFGSNDQQSAGPEYARLEHDLRENHNLTPKIEHVKTIVRRLRAQNDANSIIKKLADYRELRHLMAHYPCWFEPINKEGTVEIDQQRTIALKLYIADTTHVWEVDQRQVQQWIQVLHDVRVSIENMRRELVGASPLKADGSPPDPKVLPERGVQFEGKIEHGRVAQTVFPEGYVAAQRGRVENCWPVNVSIAG